MPKFVHLHNHTEYSLLDGLSKIPQLIKRTKELGMDAIAITDHGALYGAIEFYKACRDNDIKPIIGAELYVAPRSHKLKEGKADSEPFHLTVLAKNYQGYLNLIKLVSISHLEGFYYKPRVDKELLLQFHEGLICLSGCVASEFVRSLDGNPSTGSGPKRAEEVAKTYLNIFGEGNYYFELQNHFYFDLLKNPDLPAEVKKDLEEMGKLQEMTWEGAGKLSKKLSIPLVATNDLHYIQKEDANAQDALVCIQTAKFLTDLNRLRMIDTPNLYLKSPEEMMEAFEKVPEAVENTHKIAQKINIEIPLGSPKFPIFEIPENKKLSEYLRELVYKRAKNKFELTKERIERLDYELSVIEKKNYATYFLVVADFVNFARDNGIITNTRGSAAGSLVSYSLGITNIDPIHYMLPFERFLNPSRPSLPDIDVDLADDRRDEVIEYVTHKYGEDRVAHIITFGTMLGRAAIRDIGRVMAIPYGEVDKIAKLVPPPKQGFHKSLKESILEVPELSIMNKENSEYKQLLDLAIKVDGTVRHASVHAAGIVISPEPLTKFSPLQLEANGDKIITQYDMFAVEDIGLVKMDFLGIRNLSILGRAVEYVRINQNREVDLSSVPLSDKKAFELLSRGETMGLFQLEGGGMTKYLVDLKPTNIFDIMAMIALYRPGPLASIPEYIQRKHNPKKVHYFDQRMKEDLKRSLGLLVYQDDVLLTAINLAGYSWEEVDKFRKAMGKKIPAEMAKQKDKFVQGCIANGLTKEKAEEIFKLMEPFGAYGFNKAHAASYAMVSYQTAYMKANFPVEFMAAVMTAEYGDSDKIAAAIEECKRMGIVVLPPDINYSGVGFTIEDLVNRSKVQLDRSISRPSGELPKQGIRFGLSAIKNVGILAIESILSAREKEPFANLLDLCSRVDTRLVNRKTLESLIKAGALDALGLRAGQLLALDQCLDEAHKKSRANLSGQTSLFVEEDSEIDSHFKLPEVEEMTLDKLLLFEKDLLGFYLHEPPYLASLNQIKNYVSLKISDLGDEHVNQRYTFGGVILNTKKVITKKSAKEMAFVTIFDGSSEIECVVFPTLYTEAKTFLDKEEVVLIDGKVDKRAEEFSLIVEGIERFDPETAALRVNTTPEKSPGVEVEIPQGADGSLLKKINSTLRQYPGESPISILIPSGKSIRKMNLQFRVDPKGELIKNIEEILGPGSVRVT